MSQTVAIPLLAKPVLATQEPLLQARVDRLLARDIQPTLIDYWVGNDRSVAVFLDVKKKKATDFGMSMITREFNETVPVEKVMEQFYHDADDASIHGLMVQLPLPDFYPVDAVIEAIPVQKDVDGMREPSHYVCPVAMAVLTLADGFQFARRQVVVVGQGKTAGQPVIQALRPIVERAGGKLMIVDTDTPNPGNIAREADLLIGCTGQPNLIDGSWIKSGAWVIDVAGDVNQAEVATIASHLTPTTGAVGPLTVYYLMANTVRAAEEQAADKRTAVSYSKVRGL